ncbi:MAG TPA: DUF2279 domain-containing protein [Bacteroidetes bacterium]|nr:DUF2279 domain-containing protein [Bacteroidota bacterium]
MRAVALGEGLVMPVLGLLFWLMLPMAALFGQQLPYNYRPIKNHFLRGDDSFFLQDTLPNKRRLGVVTGVTVGGYAIAYGGISYSWYRNFPRTKFHFFNDNHEWAQVDKIGHVTGGYQGGRGMIAMFKWGGMGRKKVAFYGGMMGFLAMAPLEILDGYASKWGASWGDLVADFGGGFLAFGNEMLWSEQRIQVKVSYHPTGYADVRPDLFGDKYTRYLKDYNGHTGWISARVHSFLPESRFKDKYPRWLNVAVGYGANGLLGGYDQGITPAIAAREYRQYYLGLDVDLSAIPTRSGGLRLLLDVLNFIHLPAPTLQFSSKHGFRWHWLYM